MAEPASLENGERKVDIDLLKSFFENEAYRKNLAELLRNLSLKDKALEREISTAFVRRALAEEVFPDDALETGVDLQTQALILSGLNAKGRCLVNESLQRQAFEKILPQALKGPEDGLINSSVAQALVSYINHDAESPFFSESADALVSEMVTDKVRGNLLQRVADKALTSPLPKEETAALLARYNVTPSSRREAANDAVVPDVPPEEAPDNDVEVGNASDEFKYPDAGEFSDNAYRESEKYQLAIDARAEARDRINAILKEKPGWVERTLLDRMKAKKDQFIEDANDGALFAKNKIKYPKESIFSETLAEVDETGRQVHEIVVFKNTPLSSKATFKTPDAPKEAYEISALRLREQGIARPYLDVTFKDKDRCQQFLMQATEGLLKAGYDIDDIVVSPRVKHLFRPIYEHHNQLGLMGEEPEDLAADPDNPHLENKYGKEEQDDGPKRPSGNEPVHERIRALHEPLDAVINMYDGVEEGQSQSIRDLAPDDLSAAMSVAEFIEDDASWQRAVDEGGLNPRSNEFLKRLVGDFKDLVADVAGKEPSEVGVKSAQLVLACEKEMTGIYHDDPEGLNMARLAYKKAAVKIDPELTLEPDAPRNDVPQGEDAAVEQSAQSNDDVSVQNDADSTVTPEYRNTDNAVDPERPDGVPLNESPEPHHEDEVPPSDPNLDALNAMLSEASEKEEFYDPAFDNHGQASEGPPFVEEGVPHVDPQSVTESVPLPDEQEPDGNQIDNAEPPVSSEPDSVNNSSPVPGAEDIDLDALSAPEAPELIEPEESPFSLVTDLDKLMVTRLAEIEPSGFTSADSDVFEYIKGVDINSAHQEQIMLYAEEVLDGPGFVNAKTNFRDCSVALDDVMIDINTAKHNENILSVWRACEPSLYPVDCKEAIQSQVAPSSPDKPAVEEDGPAPPKR